MNRNSGAAVPDKFAQPLSFHYSAPSQPITLPMANFDLKVNGVVHRVEADSEMPLLWVLRDFLQLTGTKYGCGMGVCGACTVHENSIPVRSCQTTLKQTPGKEYVTIEGLSRRGDHPCQKAWIEEDVSQCGYCQGGMIMQAAALIRGKQNVTDQEIDTALSDHVCRCGTYTRMRRAIHLAAREAARP
ncbi:MAG TPA: (2Fe-2S)-binding protein [Terriglobales bacterium]|jgi:isoquinoline 1-oxidoreductase alpha subunit